MPTITLVTSDDERLQFPCGEGENVLDAAEVASLYLPAMCREGVCGICHARVSGGRYTQGPIGEGALHDAETGGVLLCRCLPESDLLVTVDYSKSNIRHQVIQPRAAKIVSLNAAGGGIMVVQLSLIPDAELGVAADFVPGQYMDVGIPGTAIRRAYSLANLPNWDGQIELWIHLKPGGAFSSWLAEQAKVGDTLELRGPFGHFVLDESSIRPRCFISGGSGFAPVLAMLRHLAEFQDMLPTTLIFAVTREDELLAVNVLEELQAVLPMLRVTICIWHPQSQWDGFIGTAADAFAKLLEAGGPRPDVYVCGPPMLIDSVLAVAAAHEHSQIFFERLPIAW